MGKRDRRRMADDEVPQMIADLMEAIPLFIPEDDEDVKALVEKGLEGKCMTCGGGLGNTTMLVINKHGIIMVFCGGACLTDMQVVSWIQEKHDDMIQAIQFRRQGSPTSGEADGNGPDL